MATIQDLEKIRRKAELARQERDRAQGAVSQLLSRLKSEHGCSSTEEGKDRVKELVRLKTKAQDDFEKAYAEFQTKYGGNLS
jgi:hypothetical protein